MVWVVVPASLTLFFRLSLQIPLLFLPRQVEYIAGRAEAMAAWQHETKVPYGCIVDWHIIESTVELVKALSPELLAAQVPSTQLFPSCETWKSVSTREAWDYCAHAFA